MRLIARNEFGPPLRIGRALRFRTDQIEAWMRNGCKPVTASE
jgi:predicted DNA-binding transcriptional regulator AlpA